ncbi:stage III sporulation protein AF [Proteiniborus sp. DW1]|uniref:stage III sporulation protein AF n=1 Tax=Proteiniborus sp. DW1 TaxID=1889883 RepID=UPI0013566C13|nr:stage III sporulation protein AF [Proteiniborus sp. DW1]
MKNWIINIVVTIFFIAFIEILLPNSNMKKYINMILGLLIIIVLINPIIKFMNNDINIDREVFYNLQSYNTFKVERETKYIETQNQQIIEVYKEKIEREISEFVRDDIDYSVLDVNVSINEDIETEDFGKILDIKVYLGTKNNNNLNQKSIKINEIERITINANKSNLYKNDTVNPPGFEEIVDSISSYYKVPKEKIIVILNA